MNSQGIVLQLRSGVKGGYRTLLPLVMVLLLLYLVLGAAYFGAEVLGVSSTRAAETTKTSADVQLHIGTWLLYLLPVLTLPVFFLAQRPRILLDGRGVHYRSRLGGVLEQLHPSWSLSWSELNSVSWTVPKRREILSRISLSSARANHTITPAYWVPVDDNEGGWPKTVFGVKADEAFALLNDTPLIKVLLRLRPDLQPQLSSVSRQTAADVITAVGGYTPATVGIAVAFMVLVNYFVLESYFTATEYYVGGMPLGMLLGAGVFSALLTYLLLQRLEPQRKDGAVYALLLGLGVGLAAHPFLARVNAWTDRVGLQPYTYHLGDDYVWHADLGNSPDVALYLSSSEWWRQYKPGDSYVFELRHGGMGLWQVNMQPIYAAQKAFYEGQRAR